MLFEKLTDQDRAKIECYIDNYGTSDSHPHPSMSGRADLAYVLRHWNREKENLYHLLGDNLIIEKQFDIDVDITRIVRNLQELSDSHKTLRGVSYRTTFSRFWSWINKVAYTNWDYMRDMIYAHQDEPFYVEHRKEGCVNPIVDISSDWFYLEDLAQNEYTGKNALILLPDSDKPYQVKHGMRLTRLLERIRKAYGDTDFTEQDMARLNDLIAMARTSTNSSFKLCLSIHPLDYMTMSDNDMNWNSCMAWKDHCGDYRQGTVECMNSPSVIVAYIREDHDMDLGFVAPPDYKPATWANKSWRQLFLVSEGAIIADKGYPYQYDNAVAAVLNWLKELAAQNWGIDYDIAGTIESNDDLVYNDSDNVKIDGHEVGLHVTWGYMYDDLGTLRQHKVLINSSAMREYYECTKNMQYYITGSGESECVWCGGSLWYDEDDEEGSGSHLVFCNHCSVPESAIYCDCCGERVSDRTYVEHLDAYLCEYCYEEKTSEDDISGEIGWNDDMRKIYLALGLDPKTKEIVVLDDAPLTVDSTSQYSQYELKRVFKNTKVTTYMTPVANIPERIWEPKPVLRNVVFAEDLTINAIEDLFLAETRYETLDEARINYGAESFPEDFVATLDRSASAERHIQLDENDLTHYYW